MSRTFDFTFYPKKPKGYKKGPVKLYLRITIDGKRGETATALSILPQQWNYTGQRMLPHGNKEEARIFNGYLDTLKNELYECHRNLLLTGQPITAELLRNFYAGKTERARYLVEVFNHHNKQLEKLIGKDFARATFTKYETTKNHLVNFIKWKFKASDIALTQVKYEFITDFEFYLKSEKDIGQNSATKYIKNVRKIINESLAKGWLKSDPFIDYKMKTRIVDRVFLSEEELERMANKKFTFPRLTQVRDIFLFSCYTGLGFAEVFNLTPDNISIGIDKKKWIFTTRQKTHTSSHIPLLPPALEILNRYKENPAAVNKGKLLPILTNQKMNAYLKEIADLCEIKKNLTYHIARHTFATTITLTNGIPIESVSKMLGHKKMQTTQHYAKILDQKVSKDMDALYSKFEKTEETKVKKKTAG